MRRWLLSGYWYEAQRLFANRRTMHESLVSMSSLFQSFRGFYMNDRAEAVIFVEV